MKDTLIIVACALTLAAVLSAVAWFAFNPFEYKAGIRVEVVD